MKSRPGGRGYSALWGQRKSKRNRGVLLRSLVLALAGFVFVGGLIFLTTWTSRGAARRATCTAQMRRIVDGLAMYKRDYGAYPPAYVERWDDEMKQVERISWDLLLGGYVEGNDPFICPDYHHGMTAEEGLQEKGLSTTYEYVARRPDSSSGAPDSEEGGPQVDPSQYIPPGALLLCLHHNEKGEGGGRWALVAYEDGSIRWEPISMAAIVSNRRRGGGASSQAER